MATQEWFTANNASSIATNINHLYLNYRAGIDDYSQERISRFLEEIKTHSLAISIVRSRWFRGGNMFLIEGFTLGE